MTDRLIAPRRAAAGAATHAATLNVVAGKPFLNQIGGFNLQDLGGVDGYEVSRPNNSEEANSSFAFLGDINGDGIPDVVAGNKKGTHIHLQVRESVTEKQWMSAQPKLRN